MSATTFFEIEQPVHDGAVWEPIDNSREESLEAARASMAALESDLGWRDLRIVQREESACEVRTVSVVEYGTDSEPLHDEHYKN